MVRMGMAWLDVGALLTLLPAEMSRLSLMTINNGVVQQ